MVLTCFAARRRHTRVCNLQLLAAAVYDGFTFLKTIDNILQTSPESMPPRPDDTKFDTTILHNLRLTRSQSMSLGMCTRLIGPTRNETLTLFPDDVKTLENSLLQQIKSWEKHSVHGQAVVYMWMQLFRSRQYIKEATNLRNAYKAKLEDLIKAEKVDRALISQVERAVHELDPKNLLIMALHEMAPSFEQEWSSCEPFSPQQLLHHTSMPELEHLYYLHTIALLTEPRKYRRSALVFLKMLDDEYIRPWGEPNFFNERISCIVKFWRWLALHPTKRDDDPAVYMDILDKLQSAAQQVVVVVDDRRETTTKRRPNSYLETHF